MLVVRITAVFLLIVLLELIEGKKEVFNITCDDQLSGDDEDIYSSDIGSGINYYCINNICSFSSDDLLKNITSDNVINIMCDVKLASVIELVGLMNISLTGYNNPTISCSNQGGLYFLFCHNIIIKGIIWERCGSKSLANPRPVIKLENSSAIAIKNCSFQHLKGQAVMLTEVSGELSIDHCMFVNNRGRHGSLMFYSSASPTVKLSITNSNFKSNKGYESIVCLNSSQIDTGCQYLIENSTFMDNGKMIFNFSNLDLHMNNILFIKGNSRILSAENSRLYFKGNSDIHILNYYQRQHFPFFLDFSTATFMGHSRILFESGTSAIALYNYSNLTIEDSSNVTFIDNRYGNLIYLRDYSSIVFRGKSTVCYTGNKVRDGGAIYAQNSSSITFEGNSRVSFNKNAIAYGYYNGGGIYSQGSCSVTFKGNTEVLFSYNTATEGGAIYIFDHSEAIIKENSKVMFYNNEASWDGGAIFSMLYSSVTFTGNSTVTFKNNRGANAGALRGRANSNMTFDENTKVFFMDNYASHNGGAMDLYDNANVVFKGNSVVTFHNNTADLEYGGACTFHSAVSFIDNATVNFTRNNAGRSGGAMTLYSNFNVTFGKANVTFSNNSAERCAGAVLGALHQGSKMNFDMQNVGMITFHDNNALVGNSVLVDFKETCNKSCFNEQVMGITDELQEHITTSPYKIVLQSQQGRLICNEVDDAYNDCTAYSISDVMLGQNIPLKGLLYDYLENPIPLHEPFRIIRFMNHSNYTSQIHENTFQDYDLSILGNKIISAYNYSFAIESYSKCINTDHHVSLHLSIQLSPCYFGFQHNNESRRCECYDRDNIVLCTESSSTIKRGFWLGTVEEKLTAAICPINYCNFTCCETTNGYHLLSPGRENQCTSHRSGVACGSCEEGYTLSYAAECVSVNRCTAGWTVLVVTLTMLYWIVIVIGVFAMMYYKLPIGYLYAITYYYSMVDVLLGQYSYLYSSLHITINILSSMFKLSPRVLGQLCLARGLSGIDIEFIQYIHPLAISIILAIITLIARCSQRVSLFIARGIIRVICFLLLLSYTSVVSTSLLLLRSLQFYDVNNIYTYLSPDIEYLHGRHLAYFIVALMFVITIITSLPLILLLEPFLNRKINFTRIKPLLDQFQGCFKNRCRWFAAYYMICRLVQIATVVYSSDYFVTQYILAATNVIVSIVHIIVRPYSNNILNVFDGIILQLMVFVSVVPVFDTIHSTVIVTATFILVIVPLLIILIMGLIIHKKTVRKLINSYNCRAKLKNIRGVVGDDNQNEGSASGQQFEMIVDDNMRKNATICDVDQYEGEVDVTVYRDSFIEVMNDIKY